MRSSQEQNTLLIKHTTIVTNSSCSINLFDVFLPIIRLLYLLVNCKLNFVIDSVLFVQAACKLKLLEICLS